MQMPMTPMYQLPCLRLSGLPVHAHSEPWWRDEEGAPEPGEGHVLGIHGVADVVNNMPRPKKAVRRDLSVRPYMQCERDGILHMS